MILGFVPALFEPFMPFKAVALRVVGFGLAAWLATEWWRGRWARPEPTGLAALAFAAITALAAVVSQTPRLAWAGEVAQREGVLTVLALVALHLAAAHAHRDGVQARATLRVVLLAAVAAAVYAQLQLAGLDPIAWSGVHTVVTSAGVAVRPASTLGSPVLLGIVLAVALPVALAELAESRSDAAFGVPAAALIAATLVLTLSRGAWLAGALGGGVAVLLALLAGAQPKRVAWTLAASLSPALVFVLGRASAPLSARLHESLDSGSSAAHALIARGALQTWSERPWLGGGPDTFGVWFAHVADPALWRSEWIGLPIHAHSVPLQTLATTGALGALAGFVWLAAAAWALVRAWHAAPDERPWLAALAGVGVALIAAGMVNVTGLAGAAVLAVLSALPAAAHDRVAYESVPVRRAIPAFVAPALMIVFAGAELLAGARECSALAAAGAVHRTSTRGDHTPSEWRAVTESEARALVRATSLWPHDDLLWRLANTSALQAAAAAESSDAERWRALAEHDARRAIALVPARASAWATLGDALAAHALAHGDAAVADSAELAYERASALAPSDGWIMVAHARFELARRDGVRALAVAQRLAGVYPEAAVGHTLAGAALLLQGRAGEARGAFEQALAARWEEDASGQRTAVAALARRLPANDPATSSPRSRRASHHLRR